MDREPDNGRAGRALALGISIGVGVAIGTAIGIGFSNRGDGGG